MSVSNEHNRSMTKHLTNKCSGCIEGVRNTYSVGRNIKFNTLLTNKRANNKK